MSELMNYKQLENQVFKNYYFTNSIPSTMGGMPDSAILQFLLALNISLNTSVEAITILRNWIGDVSWFTSRLEALFKLPRFEDESDRIYYDRLIALIDAQQNEYTIRIAIGTLIAEAITSIDTSITFAYQVSQGNWGDDGTPASYQLFFNNTPDDIWGDAETSLRAIMKITIQFLNTAIDNDLTAWYRLDGDVKDSSYQTETIDTGSNTITFIPGSPDTITRTSGDWTTYIDSDSILTFSGTDDNNTRMGVASVLALTITLDSSSFLVSETMDSGDLNIKSENNHHATNSGVIFDYAKWNYGALFNENEGDTIELPYTIFDDLTQPLTWSFWYETLEANPSATQLLVRKAAGVSNLGLDLLTDGTLRMLSTNDAGQVDTTPSDTILQSNMMYHIVYTWDGTGTRSLYIDGVLDKTDTHGWGGTFTGANSYFRISSQGIGIDGVVDEFRNYRKVINSTYIALLFNYKTTYDYWSAEMNVTKIQDLINLYKPPGINFELNLLSP